MNQPLVPLTVSWPVSVTPQTPPVDLSATPFEWVDPKTIQPREFIYGPYQRKYVTAIVAPPKTAKSTLMITETLAMITGRDLMGITPFEPIKVWILCEDPREELMRRIMAAAVHFGLKPEDLKGRLFVDSFRDKDVIIAEKTPSGAKINRPVVGAFVQEVRNNGIGHSFVDPFVLTHRVPENDNGAIAEAANGWNQVADQGDCGVGLVQHTRKTNGGEVEVDDMRGGSSLLGVVRSVRVLNHMSHSEVKAAGVSPEDRRRYIKIGEGAANMLPPSEKATWFRLESVDLNNASYRRPSDKVGVATPWTWPVTVATEIPIEAIRAVQEKVNAGLNRSSPQANDWVGFAVAEVLRLGDPSDKNNWPAIKDHIAKLVENGWLTPGTFFDAKKNVRPGLRGQELGKCCCPHFPTCGGDEVRKRTKSSSSPHPYIGGGEVGWGRPRT